MESFTKWMGEKSNQKIIMKLLKNVKKALKKELKSLEKSIRIDENWVDQFRREGKNESANSYLIMKTQNTNVKEILTSCKFSLERLISQFKRYSTLSKKKLGRILSILYQLRDKRGMDYKLYKAIQDLEVIIRQFKFGQKLEKPFQTIYYEGTFLEENSLIDGKIVLNILTKIVKADPDIKGVLLLDREEKLLAYRIKFSIERTSLEKFGKYISKMFKGYLKFGKMSNLGKYRWTRSYFTKEGTVGPKKTGLTVFPVGTHVMCIIGSYCPGIGMIRLIMKGARSELIKTLECQE